MTQKIPLRSGVWYGDRQIELQLPDDWEVEVLRPSVPRPLRSLEIEAALNSPAGSPTIPELCRGKSRPLIVVDDLNRPTPAYAVMPQVLSRISEAGIPPENVTFLMATGSHGLPDVEALRKKVGPLGDRSRMLVHNCFTDAVRIGKTKAGTPVEINKAFLDADVIIGIGGIYPNHTAGFGGGTKLVLGALGIRSIYALHFRNTKQGWGSEGVDASFRRELDEIAAMVGLNFVISPIIDPDRNVIQVFCGKPQVYFSEAVSFYRRIYETRGSGGADVVIANTYPNDLSLTFARMKGFTPLTAGSPGVTKIAIASCDEGIGLHNIWPFMNPPRGYFWRHYRMVFSVKSIGQILMKMVEIVQRKLRGRRVKIAAGIKPGPIWLYRTAGRLEDFLDHIPGMRMTDNWDEIITAVKSEHPGVEKIKAQVYTCAFLQLVGEHSPEHAVEAAAAEEVASEAV
jgi:lactate racemase